MSTSAIELIAKAVTDQVTPVIQDMVKRAVADHIAPDPNPGAKSRAENMTENMTTEPAEELPVAHDANARALRTLLQGLAAAVLLAGATAAGAAVSAPGFEVLAWDSWRGVGQTVIVAAVMAVLAYGQRVIEVRRG
ncbi:hypothetical protein [Rhodococcus ruber]|uniref:hypothetical protein n=1 Tax=Rhodococcus ruber TaxID=1830 RepID=UPI003D8162E8